MNIHELFAKHEGEYLDFKKVENKLSTRPDLHAFIMINNLFPGTGDIICAACHDQIWIDVSECEIDKLTEEHVIELRRCGVTYSEEALSMFV